MRANNIKPFYPFIWMVIVLLYCLVLIFYFAKQNHDEFFKQNEQAALTSGENLTDTISEDYIELQFKLYRALEIDNPKLVLDYLNNLSNGNNNSFNIHVTQTPLSNQQKNSELNTALIKEENIFYVKNFFTIGEYEYGIYLNLNDLLGHYQAIYSHAYNLVLLVEYDEHFYQIFNNEITDANKQNFLKLYPIKGLDLPVYIAVYENQSFLQDTEIKNLIIVLIMAVIIILLILYATFRLISAEKSTLLAEKHLKHLTYYENNFNLVNKKYLKENFPRIIAENSYLKAHIISIGIRKLDVYLNSFTLTTTNFLITKTIEVITEVVEIDFPNRYIIGMPEPYKIVLIIFADDIKYDVLFNEMANKFRTPLNYLGTNFYIELNFGVSVYPEDSRIITKLLTKSLIALMHANNYAMGDYSVYRLSLEKTLKQDLQLETFLKQAIAEKRFKVVYQPQIDPLTKNLYGMEALTRVKDLEGNFISPLLFIPIMESNKMIHDLGFFVLREVCITCNKWLAKGIKFNRVSVNVSIAQLEDPTFIPKFVQILTDTNYPPNKLTIEITETVVASNRQEIFDKLTQLKNLNINIAIDDFGTGYSSLSYLEDFDFDFYKIPKEFIDKILVQTSATKLLENMLNISKIKDLGIIVEGVETKEQLNLILSLKKDVIIQGNYFSKPLDKFSFYNFAQKIQKT